METFNFRNYDNLLHSDLHKIDPLKRLPESEEEQITNMLFAVAAGDLNSVKRYYIIFLVLVNVLESIFNIACNTDMLHEDLTWMPLITTVVQLCR